MRPKSTPQSRSIVAVTKQRRFGTHACSPAHEFFGSRKLRLAPQDYSPWTPPTDRFLVRSYPPASRHPRVLALVGSAIDEHGADGQEHWPWSAARWTNVAPTARALATPSSRGGGLATDQKAVRRRGPGRVVLGSKPQLATAKKLVRWAKRADGQKLVSWATTRR